MAGHTNGNPTVEELERQNESVIPPAEGEIITVQFEGLQNIPESRTFANLRKLKELRRHPVLMTAHNMVMATTLTVDSAVAPDPFNDLERNPKFQVYNDFLVPWTNNQLAKVQPTPIKSWLQMMVYSGLSMGPAVSDKGWTFDGTLYRLTRLKQKAPWDFHPVRNSAGDFVGALHLPTATYLAASQLVWSAWPNTSDENYFGFSDTQVVAMDIEILQELENLRAKNASVSAMRPLTIHYSTKGLDDKGKGQLKSDIANLSKDMAVAFNMMEEKDGKMVPRIVVGTTEDRSVVVIFKDINDAILMYEKRIMRLAGVPDDLGSTTTNVGSYAKAEKEFDLLVAKSVMVRRWINDMVNHQIVDEMIRYNFPSLPIEYRTPKYMSFQSDADYLKTISEAYDKAIVSKIINPDKRTDATIMRTNLGFPSTIPEDEQLAKEAMTSEEFLEFIAA